MNMIQPSKHVTRARRIRFYGNPQSGRVDVVCETRTSFSLIGTRDRGWVIALGEADRLQRMLLPVDRVLLSAHDAYQIAIQRLWDDWN